MFQGDAFCAGRARDKPVLQSVTNCKPLFQISFPPRVECRNHTKWVGGVAWADPRYGERNMGSHVHTVWNKRVFFDFAVCYDSDVGKKLTFLIE